MPFSGHRFSCRRVGRDLQAGPLWPVVGVSRRGQDTGSPHSAPADIPGPGMEAAPRPCEGRPRQRRIWPDLCLRFETHPQPGRAKAKAKHRSQADPGTVSRQVASHPVSKQPWA